MPRHSPEKVTEGLLALVAHGGSPLHASKQCGIPVPTLELWKRDTHRARYEELEAKYALELETEMVHRMRENAMRAADIERQLLERMLQAGDKEAPQALRAVSDSRAKSVDKLMTLTGRPQQITENRDMASVVRLLAQKGVLTIKQQPAIESTAIEEKE